MDIATILNHRKRIEMYGDGMEKRAQKMGCDLPADSLLSWDPAFYTPSFPPTEPALTDFVSLPLALTVAAIMGSGIFETWSALSSALHRGRLSARGRQYVSTLRLLLVTIATLCWFPLLAIQGRNMYFVDVSPDFLELLYFGVLCGRAMIMLLLMKLSELVFRGISEAMSSPANRKSKASGASAAVTSPEQEARCRGVIAIFENDAVCERSKVDWVNRILYVMIAAGPMLHSVLAHAAGLLTPYQDPYLASLPLYVLEISLAFVLFAQSVYILGWRLARIAPRGTRLGNVALWFYRAMCGASAVFVIAFSVQHVEAMPIVCLTSEALVYMSAMAYLTVVVHLSVYIMVVMLLSFLV